jgi:hypothetical protein
MKILKLTFICFFVNLCWDKTTIYNNPFKRLKTLEGVKKSSIKPLKEVEKTIHIKTT